MIRCSQCGALSAQTAARCENCQRPLEPQLGSVTIVNPVPRIGAAVLDFLIILILVLIPVYIYGALIPQLQQRGQPPPAPPTFEQQIAEMRSQMEKLGPFIEGRSFKLAERGPYIPETAVNLLFAVFSFLYFPMFEISNWQATPGKRAFRLKVVNSSGEAVSAGQAFLRLLFKHCNGVMSVVNVICMYVTPYNQGAHDLIAKTFVILDRPSELLEAMPPAPVH